MDRRRVSGSQGFTGEVVELIDDLDFGGLIQHPFA